MMVDLPWLLEAVPALSTAGEFILVHGEGRGGDGEASLHQAALEASESCWKGQ